MTTTPLPPHQLLTRRPLGSVGLPPRPPLGLPIFEPAPAHHTLYTHTRADDLTLGNPDPIPLPSWQRWPSASPPARPPNFRTSACAPASPGCMPLPAAAMSCAPIGRRLTAPTPSAPHSAPPRLRAPVRRETGHTHKHTTRTTQHTTRQEQHHKRPHEEPRINPSDELCADWPQTDSADAIRSTLCAPTRSRTYVERGRSCHIYIYIYIDTVHSIPSV